MADIRFASTPGAEVAYAIDGDGPPLLLVHAGIADMRMWDPLVALLRDRFRLIRYDLRGFGQTRYEPGEFDPAADLLAVLDAAGEQRVTALAASFGALVTMQIAARHPERFERLILQAPPLPDWEWSKEMEMFNAGEEAAMQKGDVRTATQLNVDLWAEHATEEQRALVAEMQARAFELQLEGEPEEVGSELDLTALTMPVDVVAGDRDVADFQAIARHVADQLPDARLHVVAGAGHLIALEQPEAVAALV